MKHILIQTNTSQSFDSKMADGFFSRLMGLMGVGLTPGDSLLLSPCKRIHTCFMRSCIDAVYLNRENRVLAIDLNMKPFMAGSRVKDCFRILELYAGDAGRLGIGINTSLTITPKGI